MKASIKWFMVAGAAIVAAAAYAEINFSKDFRGQPAIHRSEIKLNAESIVVSEGGTGTNGYGSVTLHTFPEGQIAIHGATADLKYTFATVISNGAGIDTALGTAANNNDGDVGDTGEANIIGSVGVDPFTNSTSAVQGQLTTPLIIDGTTTPGKVYLHFLVDDGDIASAVTGTVNGVVYLLWSEVGDY